jgi:hypothetical protein
VFLISETPLKTQTIRTRLVTNSGPELADKNNFAIQ